MKLNGIKILDEYAEAFTMWAARLIITARSSRWLEAALHEVTGYGASIIGCDAEVGTECHIKPADSPDGRCAAAVLLFARNIDALTRAAVNRAGQCVLTCPTTAVYDGMTHISQGENAARIPLGEKLRYFGDGFETTAADIDNRGQTRQMHRIPVMDGEFMAEHDIGAVKAVAGGNFLLCGRSQAATLDAAAEAADAIAPLPDVITPFPGGLTRSGSKAGSQYEGLIASTNHQWCPTLRHKVDTKVPAEVGAVYEIVIDGLSISAVTNAMKCGIEAACRKGGLLAVAAGNYGGRLGKTHLHLHQVLQSGD